MITITEVKKILKSKGYEVKKPSIVQYIQRNRIDAIESIDNSKLYDLKDLAPYIKGRVKITDEEILQELKNIRTIIL